MANPLLNQQPSPLTPQSQVQQPQQSFNDFISNIANPQAYVNQMLQQNPGAAQFIQQLQQNANGMSPREMAMQLAKQRGIDPAQLNQLASRFGLK